MERIWKETLAPAYLHDTFGIYQGIWMPQMDRCWMSNDGLQVTSRLLMTKWGKVEHAAITLPGGLTRNGENEISWSLKMEIKNELFGENRLAIHAFISLDVGGLNNDTVAAIGSSNLAAEILAGVFGIVSLRTIGGASFVTLSSALSPTSAFTFG